jgi:hypothetical protein
MPLVVVRTRVEAAVAHTGIMEVLEVLAEAAEWAEAAKMVTCRLVFLSLVQVE